MYALCGGLFYNTHGNAQGIFLVVLGDHAEN